MKFCKPVFSCLLLVFIFLIPALPCSATDDATLAQIAQANDHYTKSQ